MLYTASYFEPQHQHGSLIAISRSIPKGFLVNGQLQFLVPSTELLADWKANKLTKEEYTKRYREQLKQSWGEVKVWLNSLNPKQDSTLLCWERRGEFCHRNLIALLVKKHRPNCFGGCDVRHYETERCPDCNAALICGLDASGCTICKVWWSRSTLEKKLSSKELKK